MKKGNYQTLKKDNFDKVQNGTLIGIQMLLRKVKRSQVQINAKYEKDFVIRIKRYKEFRQCV